MHQGLLESRELRVRQADSQEIQMRRLDNQTIVPQIKPVAEFFSKHMNETRINFNLTLLTHSVSQNMDQKTN